MSMKVNEGESFPSEIEDFMRLAERFLEESRRLGVPIWKLEDPEGCMILIGKGLPKPMSKRIERMIDEVSRYLKRGSDGRSD